MERKKLFYVVTKGNWVRSEYLKFDCEDLEQSKVGGRRAETGLQALFPNKDL